MALKLVIYVRVIADILPSPAEVGSGNSGYDIVVLVVIFIFGIEAFPDIGAFEHGSVRLQRIAGKVFLNEFARDMRDQDVVRELGAGQGPGRLLHLVGIKHSEDCGSHDCQSLSTIATGASEISEQRSKELDNILSRSRGSQDGSRRDHRGS